jgi:hypothetical protein
VKKEQQERRYSTQTQAGTMNKIIPEKENK